MTRNPWTILLALALAFLDAKEQQTPTFRSSTELVRIDAHVVSRDGSPIEGLRAEQFEVFVDGRRRPVSFVEFIRSEATATGMGDAASPPPGSNGGRLVVLAVDQGSFPVSGQSAAREAATRVLDAVSPQDQVGFVAFPGSNALSPTLERAPLQQAVARIAGLRVDLTRSRFAISAVEASQLKSRDSMATQDVIARECRGQFPDPTCRQEVIQDGGRIADALEQQAAMSISGLHAAIDAVGSLPGRKTMILISAGLPMRPQGVPNLDSETTHIARRAAAANINLYVFYMNVHFLSAFSADYGKRNNTLYDDITMFGYGLEKFADSAGGSFFKVEVDSDPFVARALRETSASYVLGVQVRPEDRDGKDHFIRVSVKQRGATLRYRKVVTIPRDQ
jgi:VWFA-related protein